MSSAGETVAFIPVRGGSKSIPLKNIKKLAGKPLVCWSMEAAMNCRLIDKVYICTDSEEIRNTVVEYLEYSNNENKNKVHCISRSEETSSDTASTESVMLEFAKTYEFANIVLIQATSPAITEDDLTSALDKYFNGEIDSILSVVKQKRFIWKEDNGSATPVNYDYNNRPRRQEFEGYYVENGAFYVTSKKDLLRTHCRISGRVGTYEMDEISYYEIDEISDWIIVEKLLQSKNSSSASALDKGLDVDVLQGPTDVKRKQIKMVLTDCDGVLTDGGMYYNDNGEIMKKFNAKDGMGFQLLRSKGYISGIITGEQTDIVRRRAEKLKIEEVHLNAQNKIQIVNQLMKKYNLKYSEIAYIGDDINDLEVIKTVGIGCCTGDAVESIKEAADYITKKNGGAGAFREYVEFLLEG